MQVLPGSLLYRDLVALPDDGTHHRWLFPPASLLVHLCVGQVYAYSVDLAPLTQLCPDSKTGSSCQNLACHACRRYPVVMLLMLAMTPVIVGPDKYERLGPRRAALVGAGLWLVGSMLAAVAVRVHNLVLLFLSHGVIGGMGLGLAYISPMSTMLSEG